MKKQIIGALILLASCSGETRSGQDPLSAGGSAPVDSGTDQYECRSEWVCRNGNCRCGTGDTCLSPDHCEEACRACYGTVSSGDRQGSSPTGGPSRPTPTTPAESEGRRCWDSCHLGHDTCAERCGPGQACWDKCFSGHDTCAERCGAGDACWDKCFSGHDTCAERCGAGDACWDKCFSGHDTCAERCGPGDACWDKCFSGHDTCAERCGPGQACWDNCHSGQRTCRERCG